MRRLEKSKVNKKAHDETLCRFTPDASDEPEILTNIGLSDEGQHNLRGSSDALDFGPYMDQTPITVHPRLYLETVMDMFKQLGPRVVLLEERGKLKGLVTVKDVLKYIAHTENVRISSNRPSNRECGGLFEIMTSWITDRPNRRRQQSYTRLQNRSSIDIEESHELDRQA
ncbi:Putative Chloride channel, other eukaryote [Rhizopus microsporus]|nr:Putative Chloride channel, other eukaryote [Rhizopus microsporus]